MTDLQITLDHGQQNNGNINLLRDTTETVIQALVAQGLQKLIYLHLFTDCFMKISLQSSEQIQNKLQARWFQFSFSSLLLSTVFFTTKYLLILLTSVSIIQYTC